MGVVGELYCSNSPHAGDFSEEFDHSIADLSDDEDDDNYHGHDNLVK